MKKALINRIIIYCIVFIIILIYGLVEQQNSSIPLFCIGTIGVTSAIYLSIYIGLKLGRYRLKEESNLSKWIKKIYVPSKEIIIHFCIVVASIIVMSFLSPSNPIVQNKEIDKELLAKIEKVCGRTDINSIIDVNGNYIVTFSDKSKKVVTLGGK